MYSDTLKELMAYTNKNGEAKFGSKWRNVDFPQMLRFHGCLLHMATVKLNKMGTYWTEEHSGSGAIKELKMSRDKFKMIYAALRLYDKDAAAASGASQHMQKEKYDPLFKCRPIWNTTFLNFQKARNPDRILSLDESMAKYRVRRPTCVE